jgi:hypothetical protein
LTGGVPSIREGGSFRYACGKWKAALAPGLAVLSQPRNIAQPGSPRRLFHEPKLEFVPDYSAKAYTTLYIKILTKCSSADNLDSGGTLPSLSKRYQQNIARACSDCYAVYRTDAEILSS